MYNTKLIQSFISLNKEEKRMLNLYIRSNYVKYHKDLLPFYLFFSDKKYLNSNIITKEKAFAYIYGENKSYDDQKIRHLIWLCTKLLEEFIVQYHGQKNDIQNYKTLAEFYISKQLNRYASEALSSGINALGKNNIKYDKYYLESYYFMSNMYKISSSEKRDSLLYVNESNQQLNTYYVIELLKNTIQILTIKAVNSEAEENEILLPILNIIPNSNLLENPLIYIYYKAYILIKNDDEQSFDPLLKNLKKHEKLFSLNDIGYLYHLIINYCIKKHNLNIIKYREAGFKIYLYALEKRFLFDYNFITRFNFSNVVTLGIRLNYLAKVERFIKDYAAFIEPSYQEITIAFNEAKLNYAKKNYKKAVNILLTTKFKDVLWNLNMKHLLLKIYYETDEIELLKFQLTAFKKYVNRRNNIGYHQTYFKKVALSFKNLIKFKEEPHKFKKFKLDKDTPDYDWFSKMYAIT